MVSVFTVKDSTSVSLVDETNGKVMYHRRCRKVENVLSGEPLVIIGVAESTKFFGSESTFLCRDDFFLGCTIRLDFEYCQIK